MKLLQHTFILLSLVAGMTAISLWKTSATNAVSNPITVSEKAFVNSDMPLDETVPAAYYNKNSNSWSLSARVLEIKDVSIYGRPGSIARIEYVHGGEMREAWAVLKIDDYSFSDSTRVISVGDQITLRVSGDYVSSKGVDWNACPPGDEFCQRASFIEGGFPTSEDYGGLTTSPSNTLIYSGSIDDDWINGILAWRIISKD
jgi:hypothetical protein